VGTEGAASVMSVLSPRTCPGASLVWSVNKEPVGGGTGVHKR